MENKYLPDSFFQLLNPNNTSSYNRYIAHAIGATETIIYYSLIAKMSYYFYNGMLDDEGFFYATAIDIQESTTFTTRQQVPAIKKLVEIGLIQTKYAGIPAKKYYKILNNQKTIISLLEQGEAIANSLRNKKRKCGNNQVQQNVEPCIDVPANGENVEKPLNSQLRQNVEPCDDKMSNPETTKCSTSMRQNVEPCDNKMSHKTKVNKTKVNNPNSINQSSADSTEEIEHQLTIDTIDRIDNVPQNDMFLRQEYEEIIKSNIDYEILVQNHQKGNAYSSPDTIDEVVTIMVDTVCSKADTIRVNGGEVPQEIVKSTFLKLNSEHIDYVLQCMNDSPSQIRNIRNYLITALYNSISTISTYYTAQCKADGVI